MRRPLVPLLAALLVGGCAPTVSVERRPADPATEGTSRSLERLWIARGGS
jgi:hypothetical protein